MIFCTIYQVIFSPVMLVSVQLSPQRKLLTLCSQMNVLLGPAGVEQVNVAGSRRYTVWFSGVAVTTPSGETEKDTFFQNIKN